VKLECQICHNKYTIGRLQIHISKIHNLDIVDYYLRYINPLSAVPLCEFCQKPNKFKGFTHGFSTTCGSPSCRNRYVNKYHKQKQIDGCIRRNKKWKTEMVGEKTKQQAIIDGGKHKRKIKQKETSAKISKSLSERDENGFNALQRSFIEKYGVTNPMYLPDIKDKLKRTTQIKYGVDHIFQSHDIQKQIKDTCIEKYGVDNPMKDPSIVQNQRDNLLMKTGYNCILSIPEIKNQIKQTCLDKYGHTSYLHSDEYKQHYHQLNKQKMIDKIHAYAKDVDIEIINDLSNYNNNLDGDITFKCNKCGTEYKRCWYSLFQYWICRYCNPVITTSQTRSSYEHTICKMLSHHNIEYKTSIRYLKNPQTSRSLELDIFIPSKGIAFEIDGLYWHSNKFLSDPKYHLMKTILCEENGIHLIHIFEDEIIHKYDIVMSRILNICGKSQHRIYARQCDIRIVDTKTKNKFLNQNHIQGKDISIINIGLYHNDILVSIMTFSKGNIAKGSKYVEYEYELSRFCSLINHQVIGAASKLFNHFKTTVKWKTIFSYADRRWSYGDLYYKLGFEFSHFTPPSEWYIVNQTKRSHRFNFCKSKLKQYPNYNKELTAKQILELNGFNWIYDCGNYKFKLVNSTS